MKQLAIKTILNHCSGKQSQAKLQILMYHRVQQTPNAIIDDCSVERFAWEMQLIKRYFTVLPLADAVNRLYHNSLPPRAVCITFDDGYQDNYTVALPILKRLSLPATFFVATAYLDGGIMWNDIILLSLSLCEQAELDLSTLRLPTYSIHNIEQRKFAANDLIRRLKYIQQPQREHYARQVAELARVSVANDLMMTSQQVEALVAEGMEIQAHTHSHPILNEVTATIAREEISANKSQLESITGKPVRLFAYPNGKPAIDYNDSHIELLRELNFTAAVACRSGVSTAATDPFQLARFTPWGQTEFRYLAQMVQNYWR